MNRSFMILIPVLVSIVVLGCNRKSTTKDAEVVYAQTEIGTPVGDKITKQIGATGGTLSSPDGRLMLTVPANALSETTTFAIQPITNKMESGLGPAYRLESDGKVFATALQISFHYADHDLEGTVPEALSIAYQDEKGAWHAPNAVRLDQQAKTLRIATNHFSDYSLLAYMRIVPSETQVYVGKSTEINVVECGKNPRAGCGYRKTQLASWRLWGQGTITHTKTTEGVTYTAPALKPSPNIAWVYADLELRVQNEYGAMTRPMRAFTAKITIVDHAYRASGRTGDLTYSGVICDLSKPFTVNGSLINYKFDFFPTSAAAGAFTITAGGMLGAGQFAAGGGGTYTIEGADTDKPRIVLTGSSSGTGEAYGHRASGTGSGTTYIDLTPLSSNECGGEK